MKTTMRGLSEVANLPISRTKKSAMPALPTTAILGLSMARNKRDHLQKEHTRLAKRKNQIDRRLIDLEQEMDAFLEQARKKMVEIRGKSKVPTEASAKGKRGHRGKMVLEY